MKEIPKKKEKGEKVRGERNPLALKMEFRELEIKPVKHPSRGPDINLPFLPGGRGGVGGGVVGDRGGRGVRSGWKGEPFIEDISRTI